MEVRGVVVVGVERDGSVGRADDVAVADAQVLMVACEASDVSRYGAA